MKTIFINALSARLGGGITYVVNLLNNLPSDNIKIFILCPDPSLLPNDSRVEIIDSEFANRNIFCRMFWEVFALPYMLIRLKVSVLFVPGGMDFTVFTFGIPKVTMFRNMLPFDQLAIRYLPTRRLKFKNWILKHLMTRTMSSANQVIFISKFARELIESEVKLSKSTVIYHGISNVFKPVKSPNVNQEYLLYVSRFEPYKNHYNLIVAYSMLDESYRKRYNLVIAGEFMEPHYSKCRQFILDNRLGDYVLLKGKVSYEDLPELYQSASLFIFASSCENCPNILLEAIGCGVPVIASKTEPMPEFLKGAGLYFNEKSYQEIYDCLIYVLSQPELMADMREKSIALRETYMWENTASKTWECLKEVGDENV